MVWLFLRNPCSCMLQFGMQAALMRAGGVGLMWGVMNLMFASIRIFMCPSGLRWSVPLNLSLDSAFYWIENMKLAFLWMFMYTFWKNCLCYLSIFWSSELLIWVSCVFEFHNLCWHFSMCWSFIGLWFWSECFSLTWSVVRYRTFMLFWSTLMHLYVMWRMELGMS